MVRNRREDTGIELANRRVQIVPIHFSPEEMEVYHLLGTLTSTASFSLITLQKEMCSSKEATALTLSKMLENSAEREALEEILAKVMALEVNSNAKKRLRLLNKRKIKSLFLQSIVQRKFTCSGIYTHTVLRVFYLMVSSIKTSGIT
ncbi:hypothetical protein LSPH24S_09690 [Lysinibacillus sphaericus]